MKKTVGLRYPANTWNASILRLSFMWGWAWTLVYWILLTYSRPFADIFSGLQGFLHKNSIDDSDACKANNDLSSEFQSFHKHALLSITPWIPLVVCFVWIVASGFWKKLNNLICAFWSHVAMLSATLTFAQTHHCDITETILCCWEVANASKVKGEKLGHGGMWKIPWIQLSSWGNNITWSSWGIKIRQPLWPIFWKG